MAVAKTREDDGLEDIPFIPVADLETPVPHRKRRRSKEEGQSSQQQKRRRTKSVIVEEVVWVKWENIEGNIEIPILIP